ncbi:MAG: hypothetical protein QHC79_09275 [Pseudosphingobacterium sp.]|nr:hypothetical protein [Pseudosphingobacterium sp.]
MVNKLLILSLLSMFLSSCDSNKPEDPIQECNNGLDGIPQTYVGIDVSDNIVRWDYNEGKPTLYLNGPFSNLKVGDPILVFTQKADFLRLIPKDVENLNGVYFDVSVNDLKLISENSIDSLAGIKIFEDNQNRIKMLAACYLTRLGER